MDRQFFFSVQGSTVIDTIGVNYTLVGQDVILHDIGYFKQGSTILFAESVDIHTTVADLQAGSSFVRLNAEDDEWHGNDYTDIIKAGTGNDIVVGYGGNDKLYGETNDDELYGGANKDLLDGGYGLDYLWGGWGKDTLTGGPSSDVFDFDEIADSRAGNQRDAITDFKRGLDVIDLRTIDADTDGGKGNQAFIWIGGGKFTGVDGQLRLANGILQGDTNGDKRADFEVNVGVNKLTVTNSLATSDIWL